MPGLSCATLSIPATRATGGITTAALGAGCHLNVDNDDVLRVTKVWMNCVIREGHDVLGIVGTGVDLTSFIREVVDIPQTGVQSMFVDASGALQAHRDPRLVDFHSLTKDIDAKKTVFSLLDKPEDQAALRDIMTEVTSGDVLVQSRFMQVGGHEMLVGVGYLDRLGWYNVTFMDVDQIIDRSLFLPIGLLLGAMMIVAAALLAYLFQGRVVNRLARLEGYAKRIEAGDLRIAPAIADSGHDEIGRLFASFRKMAESVRTNTETLEDQVRKRTHELEALAFRDSMTGIANRRGFEEAFTHGRELSEGAALILIDIDMFKLINDAYGHQAGDLVIKETARRVMSVLRPSDVCARWGGDEFIILIGGAPVSDLKALAQRMISAIGDTPVRFADGRETEISVSIGAAVAERGDSLEVAVDLADTALYQAKEAGRRQAVVLEPGRFRVARRSA
jgi:diguanylate cyclase (GGDEF)-like protein